MSRTARSALLVLVALLLGTAVARPAAAQADVTVVYLARHAEKAAEPAADPPLTPAGAERAVLLALMLEDAGIERVFTTDYARTKQTALPVSARSGADAELYDPRDLAGFADRLREVGGRIFVAGHSNTTPALVQALGGDPGDPIDEDEYDRLYVVTLLPGGGASTVLLRFGERFRP